MGLCTTFVADTPVVYLDIYCRDDHTLVFGNDLMELIIDKQTGHGFRGRREGGYSPIDPFRIDRASTHRPA